MIDNNVEPSFIGNIGILHYLIEISIHEYKMLESNSIHVTGLLFEKHGDETNHVVYKDVKLGCNVKPMYTFTKM